MSITKRINRYYTVENKHTKLINEHYGVENEYYRKESTRTTVWKTSIAQNISITVGTEHSAGKRLFPWRSNGG
jgi:hypothetical protein